MTTQGELFAADAPVVPGLRLVAGAVSPAEEAVLAARIDQAPLTPFEFGQWRGKRMTAHFGSAYDFARGRLEPAPPLPGWLRDLRQRLAPLAGLEPGALEAALVIRYDPGAGIGWHRDRPQYGDVVGLSLGAPCLMRLRRRIPDGFERRRLALPPRSLYRLSGEVRSEWEHSIAPMEATRRSITFRTLRPAGG
jgi:alkylated DNA repair protein (DNA oxidative demethylase)